MNSATSRAARVVCAFDVGTNTLLARVARISSQSIETLADWATITRLGGGVDAKRMLSDDGIARAMEALASFAANARALGATELRGVATSAVRDATNGAAFVDRVRRELGVDLDVIDGAREAALTFEGAVHDTPVVAGTALLVFDVGGGSTELIAGRAGGPAQSTASVQIGSVRLTERLVRHDPASSDELHAIASAIHAALPSSAPPHDALVGIAGTVTTLVAIARGVNDPNGSVVHGATLTLDEVDAVRDLLARTPRCDRASIRGLDPGRADVIDAGATIVREVMRWAGRSTLTVSNGGVRVGLLHEIAMRAGAVDAVSSRS